ncbi:ATP-binding cassette domain-containing protein [Jatrophihabitans telluris]|uniref:ATP-binding cassette domain-containing protein n=1 Tax=Jatrophihabitans telluris TaxID=2038343 RepID=A0ABY4QU74_9ACTN|nr:ATP-binding cassette domain-containing protein [Jatrophihabitans telluris]UQX86864.1 ATP-binding cassette domain-containing protein [Jatrophihabitans telluris]
MAGITFDRVTKRYGAVTAVDNLSFTLEPGSITGFIGANGAGKSTALRVLLGLTRATSGAATFDGSSYGELPDPGRTIGALTDADVFHPGRTGRASLRVLARACAVSDARVEEMLELVALSEAAGYRVRGYSLGMRQRLGLAAALLGDPETLVLDEPANGLDPIGVRWLRELLRRLADEGRTVLVSSHQLAELAQTVDDVLILDHGRLIARGPTELLLHQHRSASLEGLFLDIVSGGRSA